MPTDSYTMIKPHLNTTDRQVMNAILAAIDEAGMGVPVDRLYELAAQYLRGLSREDFDRVMRTPLGELI